MKINRKKKYGSQKGLIGYGICYALFCLAIILGGTWIMNGLMEKNSKNQTNETIGLLAEKVNVSFDMMAEYVDQEAKIISSQKELNLGLQYDCLRTITDTKNYLGIGIIGKEGDYYCLEGAERDIKKYAFDEAVLGNESLYITMPYLSGVTGSNVITIFAPLYDNGTYAGNLFVTYSLEEVQELADTEILKQEVETYLMNSRSGNYISCSTSENHTAGVWGNLTLIKKDLQYDDSDMDCDEWMRHMRENSPENAFRYEMNGITYTQAYVKIDSMENWYVVVRIPNTELTRTLHQYLFCVSACAAALVLGTLVFALLLYWRQYKQKKRIEVISEVDPLTMLWNRRAFQEKLQEVFADPQRSANGVYLFVDLDFFKEVNDSYGHAVGDEILRAASRTLREVFHQKEDLIARVGGDEFNVLLTEGTSIPEVEQRVRKLQDSLEHNRLSDGTPLPVHCSIGIARNMIDADNVRDLSNAADKALYYVKNHGKNNFCWYHDIRTVESQDDTT